ncbi:hypothetical protein [Limnobacter sp.]|uniref:hypothetical protein n=1 Tax=Limnobacter sp. TaxID=2003368 RepID=UPI003517DA1F
MLTKPFKTTALLLAMLSAHGVASATCTGPDCKVEVGVEVNFDTSYYLSPNHNGIIVQANTGKSAAVVDLNNVIMRDKGNISANATAIGNNVSIDLSNMAKAPVRHISQSNMGDKLASVDLQLHSKSVTGAVALESIAVGNNINLSLENTSLAELSLAQCNVGNVNALVEYRWDPTKLTANASAIGNNISVGVRRP